ncbi:hypothetical protein FACS1894186_5810 [Alphaproteobacteria bacterium]|nr:hypothetical protein FACS1894186_5810 [Alphaproteobacteria bacterium]
MTDLVIRLENDPLTLPPLAWNGAELSKAIFSAAQKYQGLIVDETGIKEAKELHAKLGKFEEAVEAKRKEIKATALAWQKPFEVWAGEALQPVRDAKAGIKRQLDAFDEAKKAEKRKEIEAVWITDAVPQEVRDLLAFDRLFDSRWLNTTCTLKKANEELTERAAKVKADLAAIDGVSPTHKLAVQDVYLRTLCLTDALAENGRLEKQAALLAEAQARKQAAQAPSQETHAAPNLDPPAAPELPTPAAEPQPTYELTFRARCTVAQAKVLKAYLAQAGIDFEIVK